MREVCVISDYMISSLGFSTKENLDKLEKNHSGLMLCSNPQYTNEEVPLGLVEPDRLNEHTGKLKIPEYPRFEKMLALAISESVIEADIDITSPKTGLIVSSTKGNIDLLTENSIPQQANMWKTASTLKQYYNLYHQPLVVSNACISGVLAINIAARHIMTGKYDHMVVVGGDIISRFVVSGFQSFKSLSSEICKPFDKNRDGLSLGEGAGAIVLSGKKTSDIQYLNGSSANDANHISGPSRTGEGLYQAIRKTIDGYDKPIDYISAHGTATPYNDDMESKAIKRNNLDEVPVNSFKGYIGHTLGAAGVLETIMAIHSMKRNKVFKTYGYREFGVSEKINVANKNYDHKINGLLKIASGFGGTNAAALFEKK